MAYVTIPKDLSRIQSKVLFGLTKRQVICFGAAALVGVPLFFLAKASLGTTKMCIRDSILEDEAASRAYISQMWAEAMEIYRSGMLKLSFSPACLLYTSTM